MFKIYSNGNSTQLGVTFQPVYAIFFSKPSFLIVLAGTQDKNALKSAVANTSGRKHEF